MTTIAYDGKVLAGDSCWSDSDMVVVSRTKIERFANGCLYGGAGHSEDRELRELLRNVKKASQLPTWQQLSKIKIDLAALLVLPDGKAFVISTSNKNPDDKNADIGVLEVDVPYAMGSGGKVAMGAMGAGCSAYEAVKIACTRDINSRPPVTRLTLNPRVLPKKSRTKHRGRRE